MPFKAKKATAIDTSGDPKKLAQSTVDLAKYTEDEFAAVASALQDPDAMKISNVAPGKPRQGLIRYADGVNWNPGAGEGLYVYQGDGKWHPVSVVPHVFRATLSANQAILANTLTKVTLDTPFFDTGGYFDATNHQFLPKQAGYWQFNWRAEIPTAATGVVSLFKNGSEYARFELSVSTGSLFFIMSSSTIVEMNGTTDFVDLRVQASTAGNVSPGSSFTELAGHWIRGP